MSTTLIEEPQFKILPPDVTTASTELVCPADKVAALYAPFEKPFQAAADLLAEEETATTAFDARALRLKMVKARLLEIEKAEERAEAARIEALREERGLMSLLDSSLVAARIEALREERGLMSLLDSSLVAARIEALRDAEAKRVADQKAKEAAQVKAEALAAKKAAAAPDKLKIDGFASTVRALDVPAMKTEAGQAVAAEIAAKVENFANWIEAQAASL